MDIFFVNNKELETIKSGIVCDNDKIIELNNAGIYATDEEDNLILDRLKSLIHKYSKEINVLYLNLSTSCNLNCTYCFINKNPKATNINGNMSYEVAQIAIKQFKECIPNIEEAQIVLFGGEPLLNSDICNVVSYIREQLSNIKITVVTNGTLLDKDIIEFFAFNNVGIGISINGPKSINDLNRVFVDKSESVYDNLVTKLKELNDMGVSYSLSSTVTSALMNIPDNSIIEWLQEMGVKNVFWNLYHYYEYSDDWSIFYKRMSDFVLRMNLKLEEAGISDEKIRNHLDFFFNKNFKFQNCAAVGLNQVNITPSGDVFICQADLKTKEFRIGNIFEKSISDLINDNSVDWWEKLYTVDRLECLECEALYVCGGGCPIQAEALFGSRKHLDEAMCIYYKKYLKWLLQQYYEIGSTNESNC